VGSPRLLLLLPGAFRPGGIEAYCRLLLKAAHDVCSNRGGRAEALSLNDTTDALDARYAETRALTFRGFGRSKWRFVLAAMRAVMRLRPDVVIVGHLRFAPLALALRALGSAQQWLFLYGFEAWDAVAPTQRRALRAAERISSISAFTRAACARANGVSEARISLLPCALDPVWVSAASAIDAGQPEPLVLVVTRLDAAEDYKGVDQVIRAMATVRERVPSGRCVVVGDGTDLPRLQALVAALHLEDVVCFEGRASADDLHRWYARCSVLALPSAKEGFGIVYLEAGFHGRPSVGGDHAGAREAIVEGQTGHLVRHDDLASLADRLSELLLDPQRVAALGAAARRRVLARYLFHQFSDEFVAQLEARAP
jgi:phosphatidylinositol alpha-1,6-mannosyltransferase